MDRPAGSFIADKDGKLTPNLEDEAMQGRESEKDKPATKKKEDK